MRFVTRGMVAALCALASVPASAQTGSVQGDVYITTRGGDVKKGAGLTVMLVPGSEALRATLQAQCDSFPQIVALAQAMRPPTDPKYKNNPEFVALDRRVDSSSATALLRERVWRAVEISGVRTAPTGMNARYEFPAMASGDYYLFATWRLQPENVRWFEPINLTGASLTHDLDNNSAIVGNTGPLPPRICKMPLGWSKVFDPRHP